jgi:hypothetical protein
MRAEERKKGEIAPETSVGTETMRIKRERERKRELTHNSMASYTFLHG